jgi:ribokinase
MASVLVVGSINMDLVTQSDEFPRPGRTLFGNRFATYAGGKGANQAVAAARLGASVTIIGRVGNDAFGHELKARLAREMIDTRWVNEVSGSSTGIASITVCNSDNAILIVPGANALLTPDDLDAALPAFTAADVVLAQLEVPLETVEHAALLAERAGKTFLLNPAPAIQLPRSLLERCSLLTPNEHEVTIALGGAAAQSLPPGRLVVTKGEDGAFHTNAQGQEQHQKAFKVNAVDTTGAGDSFTGALATFWHLGLEEAIRRACAAAALSVTRPGAQEGMPTLAELQEFLASTG